MYLTPGFAFAFLVVPKVVLGAAVGLFVTLLLRRRRSVLLGIMSGIIGFLTGAFISGWAGWHAAFQNGKRLDIAAWGEDLWLRNRLAEHELLLSICLAVLVTSSLVMRRRPNEPRRN